ncbi:hypothetical protein KC887_07125 [Candidatus Kaiserbacteria bacterium]|nr:hypothetical protein [Candidatus Kaiserbacteria bacterium]
MTLSNFCKQIFLTVSGVAIVSVVMLAPLIVSAQSNCPPGTPCNSNNNMGAPTAQTLGGGGGNLNYSLISHLKNIGSFSDLLLAILNIFIVLATPIVVLFIIIAGFKYVTARGNANQVGEATRAITYALVGGLLILGAVAIAGIITNVVNSLSS